MITMAHFAYFSQKEGAGIEKDKVWSVFSGGTGGVVHVAGNGL